MTLNSIDKDLLKPYFEAYPAIDGRYEMVPSVDLDKPNLTYPRIFVIPDKSVPKGNVIVHTMTIICADKNEVDNTEQVREVWSDTEQVLVDFQKFLRNYNDWFDMVNNPVITRFLDQRVDRISGNSMVLELQVDASVGLCDVPVFDPAICGYTSNPFVPPVGPTGSSGNTGPQGPQGLQGGTGSNGVTGFQGNQGIQGPQGPQGFQGDAGSNGFQGPQGFQGDIGSNGANGTNGLQGFQGFQGPQGFQGLIGLTGNQGNQGFQGNIGTIGSEFSIVSFTGGTQSSSTISLQDLIGSEFTVDVGVYDVRYYILYNVPATTTGIRLAINGTAGQDYCVGNQTYATSANNNSTAVFSGYNVGYTSPSSVTTVGNSAGLDCRINVTSPGTITLRFNTEVSGSTLTVTTMNGSLLKLL